MDDFSALWDVLDLSQATQLIPEVGGLKQKVWLQTANEDEWLFKTHRPGTHESVAEVYAATLASLLGLPTATYQLARWKDHSGCASLKINGVQPGKQLLSRVDASYKIDTKFKNEDHTIELVADVLSQLSIRGATGTATGNACGTFLGYLMFDAWIANTDRHHENWGYIEVSGNRVLAPTYDHGSAFAWRENDETLLKRLTTKDIRYSIAHHLSRSNSALYGKRDSEPYDKLSLLQAVNLFSQQCEPVEVAHWITVFSDLDVAIVSQIVNSAPESQVSDTRKTWVVELLKINLERLLKAVKS